MKEGDSLDQFQSDLLHLLWERQRKGDGSLATAPELHQALIADGHRGLEIRTVKRCLERLKNGGFIESTQVPRRTGHPGPPPSGYRLAPDPPIITRKSTAQIVLKLHRRQPRMVSEQTCMAELLEMNLRRDDTGVAVTEADLHNQLEWCIKQEYIRVSESANDPENPGGRRGLCTTCQVDRELLLLERIGGERKGPVTADRPYSNALESSEKVVVFR